MPWRSDPAPGSVIAIAAIFSPLASVGEPALLLLVVRAGDEVGDDHVVEQRERRAVDPAVGHLLADHHVVAEVGRAPAAVLLVELEPEQPLRAGLRPDLAVDDPVLLPLVVVGDDLLVEERADGVAEGLVLLVEDLARHRSLLEVRCGPS